MVRLFVALELSNDTISQLIKVQEVLSRCNDYLRLVDPKTIHITVKFIGEIDDKKISEISDELKKITFNSFPVIVSKVTIDNFSNPRWIWCPIEDGGECRKLKTHIEDVLLPCGIQKEERFFPHSSLARIYHPHPLIFKVLDQLQYEKYGFSTISGIKLKESILTSDGPVYNDLLVVNW